MSQPPRPAPQQGPAARAGVRDRAPQPLPVDRFLDPKLSWLDFNERVLCLAEDRAAPLLERVRFLAIFARNLDEFCLVRVPEPASSPRVAERLRELMRRHAACFADDVAPRLAEHRVPILRWANLSRAEQEALRAHLREQVQPLLTPQAVDATHPFPYVSGLSLNLAALVRDPDGGTERFARVAVPAAVPRFIAVPARGGFIAVEELIGAQLGQLFSGMLVPRRLVFRISRAADLIVDPHTRLLPALERGLDGRRFGAPVRLEVAAGSDTHLLDLLVRELGVRPEQVVRLPEPLDLAALWQLYRQVDRPELKAPRFAPATHPKLAGPAASVFDRLRATDILVHHPYHSFATSVQRFLEQAAADPRVLAIKATLYRTSACSPVVDALAAAAKAGKQVVVLVEVRARFDERANIERARLLREAGCHVVHGVVGLKTHAKMALVVRREAGQLRHYCHIGTGNYHPRTARCYEDLGLLTADPVVGQDLAELFHVLTGHSRQTAYRRLLVAPHGVRCGIIERIEREVAHVRAGRAGHIQIKVNSIVDERVVDALYRASQAGVDVDLLVRGICALRPGVAGLSERIRVRSVLGRFLEHSRVLRFHNGGAEEFWIGSADLMRRNLDRRVEVLVQVTDEAAQAALRHLLVTAMSERTASFALAADGHWHRRGSDRPLRELHDVLHARVRGCPE